MTAYSAFLRAINVCSHTIKMDKLRDIFSSLKLKEVKTHIQSGNVQFESSEKEDALVRKIEVKLQKDLGYEVATFLRSLDEMKTIVSSSAYKNLAKHEKAYIVFLKEPLPKTKLPLFSKNNDVEVVAASGREAYCSSHQVKGKWGFPNAFIEKTFKTSATTRNTDTVKKWLLLYNWRKIYILSGDYPSMVNRAQSHALSLRYSHLHNVGLDNLLSMN